MAAVAVGGMNPAGGLVRNTAGRHAISAFIDSGGSSLIKHGLVLLDPDLAQRCCEIILL